MSIEQCVIFQEGNLETQTRGKVLTPSPVSASHFKELILKSQLLKFTEIIPHRGWQ